MQHCCISGCVALTSAFNLSTRYLRSRSIILTIFLLYIPLKRLWAQQDACNLTVEGVVLDKLTKQALPVAAVWIVGAEKGTTTNERGQFVITGLCPGTYTADVHYLGYQEFHLSITLPLSKPLVALMEEEDLLIEGVTVQGDVVVQQNTQAEAVLNDIELARASGKSLGESLQDLPGVTSLKTGPTISKPIINGLHSNRILVLNNGLRQEGQQWGTEHAPEIDPMVAQQISVLKGASAVRYGPEAIGGIVVVEPPALPFEHEHVHGDIRLMGANNGRMGAASGSFEGGFGKNDTFAWRLQSTTRRAGDFSAPDYLLTNTGLKELSFSGAFGFRGNNWSADAYYSRFATELGILRSAHIGNLTDFQTAIESERPLYIEDFSFNIDNPRQDIIHDLVKLTALRKTSIGEIKLIYGYQRNIRQEFDIRRGGRSDKPALHMDLLTQSADLLWKHRTWGRFRGEAGMSLIYQENRNVPGTGIEPLIPNYNSTTGGLFLIERYMRDKWEVEAGIRLDNRAFQVFTFNDDQEIIRPQYNFSNFSGSLGVVLYPTQAISISANLGTAWRPPNVSELYSQGLHHGAATIEEGNADLGVEQAFKWINQVQVGKKKWNADVTIYLQKIDNYIYLEPQAEPRLTIRGAFPVFHYLQTDVLMAGTDAAFQVNLPENFIYGVKGSMIRATDLLKRRGLIFMPGDRIQHSINWNYPFQSRKKLFITLSHSLVRRQTRYPEGIDLTDPPASYQLFGAEAGYGATVFENDFEVTLEVTNLLNTPYREYLNRFRYFADELGRTISLRINYKF